MFKIPEQEHEKTIGLIENKKITYTNLKFPEKSIALTFDDGLSKNTCSYLDILNKYNVKATFFLLGANINKKYYDSAVKMKKDGHTIGVHTYSHAGVSNNLNVLNKEQIEIEFKYGIKFIKPFLDKDKPIYFRSPGGWLFEEDCLKIASKYISNNILWNLDTKDWSMPGVKNIARVIMHATTGSIILCHDGPGDRSQTLKAIDITIPKLLKKGYNFITIDQLFKYNNL